MKPGRTIVRVEVVSEQTDFGTSTRVTLTRNCGHRATWAGRPERTPRVGDPDTCMTCPDELVEVTPEAIATSDDGLELTNYGNGFAWLRPAAYAVGSRGAWRVTP